MQLPSVDNAAIQSTPKQVQSLDVQNYQLPSVDIAAIQSNPKQEQPLDVQNYQLYMRYISTLSLLLLFLDNTEIPAQGKC